MELAGKERVPTAPFKRTADGEESQKDCVRSQAGPRRMAGGQDYEVRYEAKKIGKPILA
jgi:hypothetical protein